VCGGPFLNMWMSILFECVVADCECGVCCVVYYVECVLVGFECLEVHFGSVLRSIFEYVDVDL
jgi:hypothetical protein